MALNNAKATFDRIRAGRSGWYEEQLNTNLSCVLVDGIWFM
jgi:hypothetical protein